MLPSSSSSSSPSMSRRYESLEELLKQAGYKETRIFTPQRPPNSHSHSSSPQNNKCELKSNGSVRDVLKIFSSWVKGEDEEERPTLRHASSVPHMRGRRAQHQQPPVPTWFTSLFSQMSQRGSRTAPSTPNGKRRTRPLPRLLSNPGRPTRSHVSVTMTSVVCRPHSSSRPANKCPCRSPKRSDSTSTSSTSIFEFGLQSVSSRSSTQAEGSSTSGSSRTSSTSAFFGAKSTALRSRRTNGVPLLVPELRCPPRAGCHVCSVRGGAGDNAQQHQGVQYNACDRGRGFVRQPLSPNSPTRQQCQTAAFFHSTENSRRKNTDDSNDSRQYHDGNDDDDIFDGKNLRHINHITSMDGDERMTEESANTDEDDDDDDDDRIDLARILIPPRRQHSILSLRGVLHMDAKRVTEAGSGKRLLRANSRTTLNQNVSPEVTPRKKAFLPPRFYEFRNGRDPIGGSSSSPITPPSSPLLPERQQSRTPQPPRVYSSAESQLKRTPGAAYSQSSLPARMRNVKVSERNSLWEEPEAEVDTEQDISAVRTPANSGKSRGGLGIINLNTSSRRGRGVPPLDGHRGANHVARRGTITKTRGAVSALWNADSIR